MSEASGLSARERILERARKLWEVLAPNSDPALFDAGFTGWGAEQNTRVWESVAASRVHRLMGMVKGVKPEQLGEAIEAYLMGLDELHALRDQVRALDEARPDQRTDSSSEDLVGVHGSALADELSRRSQKRLSGATPGALASKYAGRKVAISPKVIEVTADAGASIGVSTPRAQELSTLVGAVKKVDRVDEALLELVRERASVSMRAVGIEAVGTGTEFGVISRPAVVTAALVMVLRASGVTGVRLNEEGELLVELLGDAGDLARTASIDARLALLGDQLDRMESTGRATHTKTVLIEKQGFLTNLITNFSLAERLRVVRPGTDRPESEVDVAQPKVLSLLNSIEGQARRELARRTDNKGRRAPHKVGESTST